MKGFAMTYGKHDRVKVEQELGKIRTCSVTKYIPATDSYLVKDAAGHPLTVKSTEIVGRA